MIEQDEKQITFLYSAITDVQGTIRALDVKVGIVLVLLVVPLSKLGEMKTSIYQIWSGNSYLGAKIGPILVIIFLLGWLLGLLFSLRSVVAIDDPSKHISGLKPSGIYYSGDLFNLSLIDVFINRRSFSSKGIKEFLNDLPKDTTRIIEELSYEHIKLTYIRTVKLIRTNCALWATAAYLASGIFLFLIQIKEL